jgi:2-amino-4-ketopentanoate thiolase alpha subunit
VTEPHERIGRAGDWAEVSFAVLSPGGRAPGLPPDTAAVPYEARVKGFLVADKAVGAPGCVRTLGGRVVDGLLLRLAPAPGHSFGEPVQELIEAGRELRERLAAAEGADG